eukprot:7180224-Karenia_brevis.AAC.1
MDRLLEKTAEKFGSTVEEKMEKQMEKAIDKFQKIMDQKIQDALKPINKRLDELEKKTAASARA